VAVDSLSLAYEVLGIIYFTTYGHVATQMFGGRDD
jgi:hypothetical protein